MDLDKLPQPEAEALLLRIAPRIQEHAPKLAHLCGCLPLALRLAASALAERENLGVMVYQRMLEAEHSRLKVLDRVEASLALSYNLLAPDLQQLWRVLAVFPADFDDRAVAAIWRIDLTPANEHLGELLRFSLLEFDKQSARYRLHDLARDFAGSRLTDVERDGAQRRHAEHYRSVLAEANEIYMAGGENVLRGLALFDLEQGNILTVHNWAAAHADEDEEAARLASDYGYAGVYVLGLRQHPRERIDWLETALAAARRLKDRSAEGAHLGNLGNAYFALGEPRRAIEYHEQQLVIAREIGDRRGEGNALGNLGLAYAALGEPRRAIEYYEQWLVITREIGDRQGESTASWNLGLVYEQQGELQKAVELLQFCVDFEREIGHPDTAADGAHVEELRAKLAGRT